jgi:hypothetical protein
MKGPRSRSGSFSRSGPQGSLSRSPSVLRNNGSGRSESVSLSPAVLKALADQLIATELQALVDQVEARKRDARELYSKLRNERERVTFSMMMKMNPEALTAVRKEFFMREDKVKLHEFIYIIQKHLLVNGGTQDEDLFGTQTTEQRTFAFNMCELFNEIDVNGDGDLEWQVSLLRLYSRSLFISLYPIFLPQSIHIFYRNLHILLLRKQIY